MKNFIETSEALYTRIGTLLVQSEGEITPEIQRLIDSVDDDLKSKIHWCCKRYRDAVNKQIWAKAKADMLAKKAKSAENAAEYFKVIIDKLMQSGGFEELDIGEFDIKYRKSESTYVNQEKIDEIPDDYKSIKESIYINKASLKKDIKEGRLIIDPDIVSVIENRILKIE